MPFMKYKNPDKNCTSPFENDALGYCWGYANAVDKGEIINCSRCEFYKPNGISYVQLQFRIIYSIIVAGKSAKFAEKVMTNLLGIYSRPPFGQIQYWNENGRLLDELKKAKTGNYKKISKALTELVNSNIDLRTCGPEDLEKIHGIGPKTSRFFIMWTRPNVRYAALDTHILKWLRARGHDVPKTTPSGKKYKEIEQIFLTEADKLGIPPQELDTKIWKEYSGYKNWNPDQDSADYLVEK